jgi:hypothetical protein
MAGVRVESPAQETTMTGGTIVRCLVWLDEPQQHEDKTASPSTTLYAGPGFAAKPLDFEQYEDINNEVRATLLAPEIFTSGGGSAAATQPKRVQLYRNEAWKLKLTQIYVIEGPANLITPGIHFSVGDISAAYQGICAEAGSFEGLKWAEFDTLADAEACLRLAHSGENFKKSTLYFEWILI